MIRGIILFNRIAAISAALILCAAACKEKPVRQTQALADEGAFPGFAGATGWINSPPLDASSLKGKVVLVDFWTYSCINCLRSLPYVKAWYEKYKDKGLVVVGVHTPEFDFEKERANVEARIKKLGVNHPVAMDNDMAIWDAFHNQYWPAHYFVDKMGRIRYHHYGEGKYAESEHVIQQLLGIDDTSVVQINPTGEQAASKSAASDYSPETYLGVLRSQRFSKARNLAVDTWTFTGNWKTTGSHIQLVSTPGTISYNFRGRDLHLVMGTGDDGKPIRFRVTIDGKAPGESAGMDVTPDGTGTVDTYKLYQLIRLKQGTGPHVFKIEFLEPGIKAYSFTFG